MKNVYLIHIPKTAGNSIKKYFVKDLSNSEANYLGQLQSPIDVCDRFHFYCYGHNNISDKIDRTNSFTFSFVRNPLDKLVSAYHYLRQCSDGHLLENDRKSYIDPNPNFDEFVKSLYRDPSFYFKQQHIRPQTSILLDRNDHLYVDFIGKFESLDDDFNLLCNILQIPKVKLEVTNTSIHDEYETYYTKNTRRMVLEIFHKDIELLYPELKLVDRSNANCPSPLGGNTGPKLVHPEGIEPPILYVRSVA